MEYWSGADGDDGCGRRVNVEVQKLGACVRGFPSNVLLVLEHKKKERTGYHSQHRSKNFN